MVIVKEHQTLLARKVRGSFWRGRRAQCQPSRPPPPGLLFLDLFCCVAPNPHRSLIDLSDFDATCWPSILKLKESFGRSAMGSSVIALVGTGIVRNFETRTVSSRRLHDVDHHLTYFSRNLSHIY
jgi:hypothetical protein